MALLLIYVISLYVHFYVTVNVLVLVLVVTAACKLLNGNCHDWFCYVLKC